MKYLATAGQSLGNRETQAQINFTLCSGFGQYHTNEPDSGNPNKVLRPYSAQSWSAIQGMMEGPLNADKAQGQWIIPSSYLSRTFKEQEAHGHNIITQMVPATFGGKRNIANYVLLAGDL